MNSSVSVRNGSNKKLSPRVQLTLGTSTSPSDVEKRIAKATLKQAIDYRKDLEKDFCIYPLATELSKGKIKPLFCNSCWGKAPCEHYRSLAQLLQ